MLFFAFSNIQEVLENITIHLNVDSLEGGMDGLVQVLTCTDVCLCSSSIFGLMLVTITLLAACNLEQHL